MRRHLTAEHCMYFFGILLWEGCVWWRRLNAQFPQQVIYIIHVDGLSIYQVASLESY